MDEFIHKLFAMCSLLVRQLVIEKTDVNDDFFMLSRTRELCSHGYEFPFVRRALYCLFKEV